MMEEPGPVYSPQERAPRRPRLTYIILGVTIFVYLLQELTRLGILSNVFLAINEVVMGEELFRQLMLFGWGDDPLVLLGGKINPLIQIGQFWRFFTPALLHGSLLHIGFNMYALFAIGPTVETYFGKWRFLALYLLGAFGGTVLSFIMSPAVSIGASGAIFGMIGAETVFIFQNRQLLGQQARPMLMNSLFIIGLNFFLGLTSPGIDNWGHLGGLLAGVVFAWFGGPVMSWQQGIYTPRLVDTRPQMTAILSGVAVAVIFVGLATLGFQ